MRDGILQSRASSLLQLHRSDQARECLCLPDFA
jgi:hypothetical protein